MRRTLLLLTFVFLADQGPRVAETHPLVRRELLDAIDVGDEAAKTEALSLAYTMLKAAKVERRRVVLVTHATGALPAGVVKLGAKLRAAGIETAALGFETAASDHLARFAEEEVFIALDSAVWPRFFRVAMEWIR